MSKPARSSSRPDRPATTRARIGAPTASSASLGSAPPVPDLDPEPTLDLVEAEQSSSETRAREQDREVDPELDRDLGRSTVATLAPPEVVAPVPPIDPEPEVLGDELAGRAVRRRATTSGIDARTPTAYLPGLDGLRAIAVVAVVAYHLGELPGGFLGVDVFFVVSGFLITRLLLAEREREGRISLGQFWLRRFKRLVPALLVMLTTVAILSKAWLPAWRMTDIRNDGLAALSYVANWRFVWSGQSYFTAGSAPSPLRHTWSLAIEEQYYLFWPLVVFALVALGRSHARRLVAWVCAIGAIASATWMVLAIPGHDLSRIYYGTDTRIFALFAGAWVSTWWDPAVFRVPDRRAHRVRSRRLARGATVALVPLAVLFVLGAEDETAFYRFGFQATAVLSVLIVAGVATGHGRLNQELGSRVLVWVGRRSYSIYLWSWPVQVFAEEQFRVTGLRLVGVVFALAFALAALSYWLVEEPVRRGRRPAGIGRRKARAEGVFAPPNRVVPRPVAAVFATVVVAGVIVVTAIGSPEPPAYFRTSDEEAVAGALEGTGPTVSLPPTSDLPTDSDVGLAPKDLPPGPFDRAADALVDPGAQVDPSTVRDRPLKVMVAGDSVGWSMAWHLGPEITDTVKIQDRAIIGCGVMPPDSKFVVQTRPPEFYGDQCVRTDLAEARGLAEGPDVVLYSVGAWEVYDQYYLRQRYLVGRPEYRRYLELRLQQRIDRFRHFGAATIIPRLTCFGENAMRLGDERHQQRRIDWVNARIEAVAARNPGWVRIVDPFDQLCDGPDDAKSKTPTGVLLREDGAHFNSEAAVWFWNTWLSGQLGAAFENGTTPWPPPSTTTTSTAPPVTTTTTG